MLRLIWYRWTLARPVYWKYLKTDQISLISCNKTQYASYPPVAIQNTSLQAAITKLKALFRLKPD